MLAAKSAKTGKIRVTNSPSTRGLLLACDGILGCRPSPVKNRLPKTETAYKKRATCIRVGN